MGKNVGAQDKNLRLGLGLGLVLALSGLFLSAGTTLKAILFILAAVAFVTGAVGFCPLYKVLGISTCKAE